jgi:hypothetical protein
MLKYIFNKLDESVEQTDLVHDTDRCIALVKALMNPRFHKMRGIS